jgi:hypothetical protein
MATAKMTDVLLISILLVEADLAGLRTALGVMPSETFALF